MLAVRAIAFGLLLLAKPALAQKAPDPCAAASTVSDVRFQLTLKDHRAVFRYGEIIPVVLSFSSRTKNRYWLEIVDLDGRGGVRQDTEFYCVEPAAPDPLAWYFKLKAQYDPMQDGFRSTQALGETPFREDGELNEWRTLGPGHHRVYAVSRRISDERTPNQRLPEVVRSNAIEIEVKPPDPEWQSEQLRSATQTLAGPSSPEDARHAARILRFLNSKDSTRQLAKLFWGVDQQRPIGWDLVLGLYGSSDPQFAVDSMEAELAVPGHAITNVFLEALVDLQLPSVQPGEPPAADPQEFEELRRQHIQQLTAVESQAVIAAFSRKTGGARALTLEGLVTAEYAGQSHGYTRSNALKDLYELDPAVGREAILSDLQNDAEPGPAFEVIKLLSREDLAIAVRRAVERIRNRNARDLDFDLVDRYSGPGDSGVIEAAFEDHLGKWGCPPQSAMLRYFLRVAPEYGAKAVGAALSARKDTVCYKSLLLDLGAQLPKAQQNALHALDDPDPGVVQDAARALGRWGSPDAATALWARLQRFHEEWAGREDELRPTPDPESPGSRGASLEKWLVSAIATAANWTCAPDTLARLAGLVWTKEQRQQIEYWNKQWKQGAALISPMWFPEDSPTFSVFQYYGLTEEQLRAKVVDFPSGTRLRWQFDTILNMSRPPSMVTQEAVYERVRADAERHGIVLTKANQ